MTRRVLEEKRYGRKTLCHGKDLHWACLAFRFFMHWSTEYSHYHIMQAGKKANIYKYWFRIETIKYLTHEKKLFSLHDV